MKFIVELRLKPGSTNLAIDAFELRGPNRAAGVSFRAAWVSVGSEIVFALVESAEERLVQDACHSWAEVGASVIYPVVEIEQF